MKPDGKWWDPPGWNPTTGCTPVSAGCEHCWAKRMHARWVWQGPFSKIILHHDRLEQPLRWRKPRRVAVSLMGDLFHPDVPEKYIVDVFHIMYRTPRHFYFVLTKRLDRLLAFGRNHHCDLPNVAFGVSCEDQKTTNDRLETLAQIVGYRRKGLHFVSLEPLLGAVRLQKYELRWLDWVIVGSESGPGARPMDLDWVRSIRDQCIEAGTPLWFKQRMEGRTRIHMPELDEVVYDQMPKRLRADDR